MYLSAKERYNWMAEVIIGKQLKINYIPEGKTIVDVSCSW